MDDSQLLAQVNETLQATRAAQASASGKPMVDANGVKRMGLVQVSGLRKSWQERLADCDRQQAEEEERRRQAVEAAQKVQDDWDALPEEEKTRRREAHERGVREQRERNAAIEREQRARRWKSVQSHIGERYASCTLGNYETPHAEQKEILQALRTYSINIRENVADGINLVFLGPPGTGKDHLMIAVLREAALSIGAHVKWANGVDMFGAVRDAFDQSVREADLFNLYTAPTVLAISDPTPPCGSLTEWQRGVLFRIIDARYRRKLPTFVTMNSADRNEAENAVGPNIIDRLGEGALVLKCDWPSYRQRS